MTNFHDIRLQQHIAPKDWQLLKEKRLVAGDEETLNLILTKVTEQQNRERKLMLGDDSCEELGSNSKEGASNNNAWEDLLRDATSSESDSDSF